MATELAQAYVQIIPSAEGIAGNLENLIGSEAESAGISAGSLFSEGFGGALGGILTASGEIVSGMVDIFASMTETISQNFEQMATYGDSIDKLSQKLGISATALQEWDFIAQHSGTSIDALRGSFKILSTQAQSGAAEFEQLGLSLEDVSTMSTEDLFGAVIEGLQGMEAGTERTALASKLLGRGASELGALLNMSAEDTEEMKNRVHDLGGVLSDEAVKSSAAYKDSMQDMMVSLNGIKNNLVSDFLPSITSILTGITDLVTGDESGLTLINQGVTELITNLSVGFSEVVPTIIAILLSIGDAIIENLPLLMESGVQIIGGLVSGIMEQIPLLMETAYQILIMLTQGLAEATPSMITGATDIIVQLAQMLTNPDNLNQLLSAGLNIILSLSQGIIDSIPVLIEALPEIINNIIAGLLGLLPELVEGAAQLVVGLVQNIPQIISSLIGALPTIIDTICEAYVQLVPKLIEAAITMVNALVTELPNIISAIVNAIPQIIDAIINGIITLVPLMVDAGVQLFVALIQALPQIIEEIIPAIPEIVNSLCGAIIENLPYMVEAGKTLFLSLIEQLPDVLVELVNSAGDLCASIIEAIENGFADIVEIGKNIVLGLWEGFKAKWGEFVEDIHGKVKGFIGDIKNFLGIASPSKVFKEIGNFVVEGFDEGTENLGEEAIQSTRDMIDTINKMAENELGFDTQSAINSAFVGGNIAIDSTNNYLYNLLATYLPEIASGKNVKISLEGDADGLFNVVKKQNTLFTERTNYNPMVSG